jgi:hypothetical protein
LYRKYINLHFSLFVRVNEATGSGIAFECHKSAHLFNHCISNALEEEDDIIVNWAQEDVETLYSLLNK